MLEIINHRISCFGSFLTSGILLQAHTVNMFPAVRVARSASAAQVSRRTLFGSSGSKDPVSNVFLQELKKLKVCILNMTNIFS